MTMVSMKGLSGVISVARSKSSIVVPNGGLAIFLVVVLFLIISYPISSSFQGYFHERAHLTKAPSSGSRNNTGVEEIDKKVYDVDDSAISDDKVSSESENAGAASVSSDSTEVTQNSTEVAESDRQLLSGLKNGSENVSSEIHTDESASSGTTKIESGKAESTSCYLYQGKWIYEYKQHMPFHHTNAELSGKWETGQGL